MRLKSFQARSITEAMRLVEDSLGEDAIIVSTREEPSGWVRITAAVEQSAPEPERHVFAAGARVPPAPPEIDDSPEILETITDALLRHRVPAQVSDKVISAAAIHAQKDAQTTLAKALEDTFGFDALRFSPRVPVMLVGPPGAGKTLMTAKLAAEAVLNGQRPAVITTDIARAGGVEQLEAFLDILALPLHQAQDAKSLGKVLEKIGGNTQIIIDTGGLNPFDPKEMKSLSQIMNVTDMEPALVLPAGIDSEEAAEMAQTFGVLGVRKMIPTRLDFARRLGSLLSAADKAGLSFTEASHTPQVANGIIRLSAGQLASLLIPQKSGKTSKTTKSTRR